MKLTITIPDEKYEKLEQVAGLQSLIAERFIERNIDFLMRVNPRENQILLKGSDVDALSRAVGGKTLRTAEDVVKLLIKNFTIGVDGIEFKLTPEDAHTLKAQYEGMSLQNVCPYDEYVSQILEDSLSLYLWGSTTGKFAYR